MGGYGWGARTTQGQVQLKGQTCCWLWSNDWLCPSHPQIM